MGGLSYDTDTGEPRSKVGVLSDIAALRPFNSADGLLSFFQQFGDVADAKVMRSAEDGRHRGFG